MVGMELIEVNFFNIYYLDDQIEVSYTHNNLTKIIYINKSILGKDLNNFIDMLTKLFSEKLGKSNYGDYIKYIKIEDEEALMDISFDGNVDIEIKSLSKENECSLNHFIHILKTYITKNNIKIN